MQEVGKPFTERKKNLNSENASVKMFLMLRDRQAGREQLYFSRWIVGQSVINGKIIPVE